MFIKSEIPIIYTIQSNLREGRRGEGERGKETDGNGSAAGEEEGRRSTVRVEREEQRNEEEERRKMRMEKKRGFSGGIGLGEGEEGMVRI